MDYTEILHERLPRHLIEYAREKLGINVDDNSLDQRIYNVIGIRGYFVWEESAILAFEEERLGRKVTNKERIDLEKLANIELFDIRRWKWEY